MNTNTINATVSTSDQEAVTTATAAIKQKLPFLIDLTTTDRQSLVKLGDKSQAFVKKALDVAEQNPGVLPAAFAVNQMRQDVEMFAYLSSVQLALGQLCKQIDDTALRIGSQAYAAARTVYASATSSFAGAALQTAAGELGRHFARKTRATASDAEPTPGSPPPVSAPAT